MSYPYYPFYSKTLATATWQYIYPLNSVLCANFVLSRDWIWVAGAVPYR
jgi:hypothetical protein